MDLCVGVAKQIASARSVERWGEYEVRVRNQLRTGNPLCLLVRTTHVECRSRCARSEPIELWTVCCEATTAPDGVEPMFVSSAVRSQLHFSPLQSWLSTDGLPAGIELTTSFEPANSVQDLLHSLTESHHFPPSKSVEGVRCMVSVRFVRSDSIPRPLGFCPLPLAIHTVTGSASSSPVGSPLDAPLVPSGVCPSLSALANSPNHFFATPEKAPLSKPAAPSRPCSLQMSALDITPEAVDFGGSPSRPQTLSLLSPTGGPAAKVAKIEQPQQNKNSPARRILFSDSSLDPSTGPDTDHELPSPLKRLLDPEQEHFGRRGEVEAKLRSALEGRVGRAEWRSSMFSRIGLPLHSSPTPPMAVQRRRLRNSICLSGAQPVPRSPTDFCVGEIERTTNSAPSRSLLCNFEESALHGRLDPLAEIEGFTLQIAACAGIMPSCHLTLPVRTFFFDTGDGAAPSPYLGICSLEGFGKRGIKIPRNGILQVTLFNPQGTVVRMFVQKYDLSDMPPQSQTFLRQRTFFMRDGKDDQKWLRYLVHFKILSDRRARMRLHGDIRMLFAPNNTIDALNLEPRSDGSLFSLRSFTEMPKSPKYSPTT